ncbi:MAG: hypothetical protein R2729_24305 [Bryobacteraceae bacterium]
MSKNLAALKTAELQEILRDTPGRPLPDLLNAGAVRIDAAARHVYRDSFWKGSFASDTALGFAEILGAPALGPNFSQGSFWKRFDRIDNGVCTGHVVNYELHWLPGEPEVRAVDYADAKRKYFRAGDPILLLNYLNQPYRIVYDAMKVIDDATAVGVMHLGTYPKGMEFATFYMERHNYPFAKMSADDFRLLPAQPGIAPLDPAGAEGRWEGTLLTLADPNRVLLAQVNPHRLNADVKHDGNRLRVKYRIGIVKGVEEIDLSEENEESAEAPEFSRTALALPGAEGRPPAIAGRWVTQDTRLLKLPGMAQYAEPAGDGFAFYFFLERK